MCKSFHEQSLELPSEASVEDGDPLSGRLKCFFLLPLGGKEEGPVTMLFSVLENKASSFICSTIELRRKQSQGKVPCNVKAIRACQMSEISSGCTTLCFSYFGGKRALCFSERQLVEILPSD